MSSCHVQWVSGWVFHNTAPLHQSMYWGNQVSMLFSTTSFKIAWCFWRSCHQWSKCSPLSSLSNSTSLTFVCWCNQLVRSAFIMFQIVFRWYCPIKTCLLRSIHYVMPNIFCVCVCEYRWQSTTMPITAALPAAAKRNQSHFKVVCEMTARRRKEIFCKTAAFVAFWNASNIRAEVINQQ